MLDWSLYEDKVKEILDIPQDIRVVALLALGYPVKLRPKPKDRLRLKEIVMYEGWRG